MNNFSLIWFHLPHSPPIVISDSFNYHNTNNDNYSLTSQNSIPTLHLALHSAISQNTLPIFPLWQTLQVTPYYPLLPVFLFNPVYIIFIFFTISYSFQEVHLSFSLTLMSFTLPSLYLFSSFPSSHTPSAHLFSHTVMLLYIHNHSLPFLFCL